MSPKVFDALLRKELAFFIAHAFRVVSSGQEYLPNWHVDAIAWHLQQCQDRKIRRLIITMPPRHLKSISVSVAFAAWALGQDPTRRIIGVSYAQDLSTHFSLLTRRVMESPAYLRAFPRTRLDPRRNTQTEITTTRGGGRYATSVGGTLTGRGGSLILIDDPHKAEEALSEAKREAVLEWFRNTLLSRLDSKHSDVIVLVMQRLHENDLAGLLLEQGGWVHLELPAIAEERQEIATGPERIVVRKPGDVLHPAREPREVLDRLRAELGSYAFAAQYQQRPAPAGGGLVKWEWFRQFARMPERSNSPDVVLSLDTAVKADVQNDYTVCTVWLKIEREHHLLHLYRDHLEFPDLKRRVQAWAKEWSPNAVLIEDAGAGSSLIQELRRETSLSVIGIIPKDDKRTRMMAVTPVIESGRVILPKEALWLPEFQREVVHFPNGKHDDQIDSMSQYLNWARERERTSGGFYAVQRRYDPDYPGHWIITTIGGENDSEPQLVYDPRLPDV